MPAKLRVLGLQPFDGGSHRSFLSGWTQRSQHSWTVLPLSPHHWKWRMRHGAIAFAEQARELIASGSSWDIVWCTDMLDLAAFRGLAPAAVARLPAVVYFHENQLTYPVREQREHDLHFAFTNLTTALAAKAVWFNSAFHRDDFLAALRRHLTRMPDHQPVEAVDWIEQRSEVQPPGVQIASPPPRPSSSDPLHLLWAARWEFDKAPDAFFDVLRRLQGQVDFQVSVLGESFREVPPCFEQARRDFAKEIVRFGYLPRDEYVQTLADADVFVSTAIHEFFGIGAVEAMTAGLYPLLPNRLSYPELLGASGSSSQLQKFLYEDDDSLLNALLELAARKQRTGEVWEQRDGQLVAGAMRRFSWPERAAELDDALERIAIAPLS